MLTLFMGDILTITARETMQMAVGFALVALLYALFNKEFVLVSFRPRSGGDAGIPRRLVGVSCSIFRSALSFRFRFARSGFC